jgi:lysophospholipid acyltransferase (LPLAT)-like uncharacterized protein
MSPADHAAMTTTAVSLLGGFWRLISSTRTYEAVEIFEFAEDWTVLFTIWHGDEAMPVELK